MSSITANFWQFLNNRSDSKNDSTANFWQTVRYCENKYLLFV